jgi:hypothetical protein
MIRKTIFGIVALMLAIFPSGAVLANSPEPQSSNRVSFTQTIDNVKPTIGDVITVTLVFNTRPAETQSIKVKVVSPNPDPAHLQIIANSPTGGATYTASVGVGGAEGVVWEGDLLPAGSLPNTVTYKMKVLGIPAANLASGLSITNTATMSDTGTGSLGGSLPITTADAQFVVQAYQIRLPTILK